MKVLILTDQLKTHFLPEICFPLMPYNKGRCWTNFFKVRLTNFSYDKTKIFILNSFSFMQ